MSFTTEYCNNCGLLHDSEDGDCLGCKMQQQLKQKDAEIKRLGNICKEFIYCEENPSYYKTMEERLKQKDQINEIYYLALKDIKECGYIDWDYGDIIEDLEDKARKALIKAQKILKGKNE